MSEVFTVEQVLARAQMGRTKFYQEVAAGRLIARKRGRQTVVLAEDLDAYNRALPKLEIKQ